MLNKKVILGAILVAGALTGCSQHSRQISESHAKFYNCSVEGVGETLQQYNNISEATVYNMQEGFFYVVSQNGKDENHPSVKLIRSSSFDKSDRELVYTGQLNGKFYARYYDPKKNAVIFDDLNMGVGVANGWNEKKSGVEITCRVDSARPQ